MTLSGVLLQRDIAYFLGSCLDKTEGLKSEGLFLFFLQNEKNTESGTAELNVKRHYKKILGSIFIFLICFLSVFIQLLFKKKKKKKESVLVQFWRLAGFS